MSFIEDVLIRTRRIERLLSTLGANGKGLHEKVNSILSLLSISLVKRLRFIASVRNAIVHEEDYKYNGDEAAYLSSCDSTISDLEAIHSAASNKLTSGDQLLQESNKQLAGNNSHHEASKNEHVSSSELLEQLQLDIADHTSDTLHARGGTGSGGLLSIRVFLGLFLSRLTGALAGHAMKRLYKPAIAQAAPFVKSKVKWAPGDFSNFLKALPTETMLDLQRQLGIIDKTADASNLQGPEKDAREVQKRALWLSSNVMSYLFRDEKKFDYHRSVMWVCSDVYVSRALTNTAPTFKLERELQKLVFAQLWDKLTLKQREELLAKIDSSGSIKDKAAIAALSGAGALSALSPTVAFTGFAFYTTMSITIATVAGLMGLTLPFAAYTSASALVGVLSGPAGWAITGAAALGGVALAGRANVKKMAALIGRIHALKVEAVVAAGVPEKDVFN